MKIAAPGPDGVLGERLRQPHQAARRTGRGPCHSAWINQQLDEAAVRHPELRIIDWSTTSPPGRADPRRTCATAFHATDPLGGNARNQLIIDAIQGSVPGP